MNSVDEKVYDRKRHGGGDPVHAKPRVSKLLEAEERQPGCLSDNRKRGLFALLRSEDPQA